MKQVLLTSICILTTMILAGCAADSGSSGGADSDADSDSDGDTDADSDADADTDADTDADCDEEGVTTCLDDWTAVICEDGEWVVIDECEEGEQLCEEGECIGCVDIAFTIETMRSCAISILDGFEVDGEGFIDVEGDEDRVFAMDRWGEDGHIIAWCDTSTIHELLEAFNVICYLGQVDEPVVASFGDHHLCDPEGLGGIMPDYVNYLGEDMPAEYVGNAAQMAADFDVLIFCGFRIDWLTEWSTEIESFVTDHGKGFLAAMDYFGVVMSSDFNNMNLITDQAGIHFESLNLESPTAAEVVIECVPDLPPGA